MKSDSLKWAVSLLLAVVPQIQAQQGGYASYKPQPREK